MEKLSKISEAFFDKFEKALPTMIVIIIFLTIFIVAFSLSGCSKNITPPVHKVKQMKKPAKVLRCNNISKFQIK